MEPNPASPDNPNAPGADIRRRRILFRATHRGTHETDLLIGGFVAEGLETFTSAELDELEEIMELLDVDLADWLTGRRPIPAGQNSQMLQRIARAAQARSAEARSAEARSAEARSAEARSAQNQPAQTSVGEPKGTKG